MMTAEEQAWAHVWREAHGIAAKEMPLIKSGVCQQPGLAATLAIFAKSVALAEREACAKLADLQAALDRRKGETFAKSLDDDGVAQSYEDFAVTAESIARAIRFRDKL